MAQILIGPQPRPEFNWVDNTGRPTLQFAQYMARLDALVRGLQTAVATPTNANAAAAGVPIGGLYTSTADPAQVYIRTA